MERIVIPEQAEMNFAIDDLNQAILLNPRNCYQRFSCATNNSDKTIYTYMGKLLPYMGNNLFRWDV